MDHFTALTKLYVLACFLLRLLCQDWRIIKQKEGERVQLTGIRGFSLIELMIVVAIIGILAAVGLPAYQDYTSRARVAEPISLLRALKSDVHSYHGDHGQFPTVSELTAYAGAKVLFGKFTSAITSVSPGLYQAQMRGAVGARINSATVALSFYADGDGLLAHTCKPGTASPIPDEYLPWECRANP